MRKEKKQIAKTIFSLTVAALILTSCRQKEPEKEVGVLSLGLELALLVLLLVLSLGLELALLVLLSVLSLYRYYSILKFGYQYKREKIGKA